jgi:hypothetical protein
MFFNKKAVSKERLIGISFADILIQAVFLLFIALTVGYQDPVIIERVRDYKALGEDICNKVNKSSIKECVETLNSMIEKDKKRKGDLALCIEPETDVKVKFSAIFDANSPKEVYFRGFTNDYLKYLENKGMMDKLEIAKKLNFQRQYPLNEIEKTFGFMRESNCIHKITYRYSGSSWTPQEMREYSSRIVALESKSQ